MINLRKCALYVEVSHPGAGMKVFSVYNSAYCFIRDKGRMRALQTLTRGTGTVIGHIKRHIYIYRYMKLLSNKSEIAKCLKKRAQNP